MILFKEIETFLGDINEEYIELYRDAESEFFKLYDIPADLHGASLINTLFDIHKELLDKYLETNEITCKSGCSHCCKQLICCTTVEMENIVRYINTMLRSTKRTIIKKVIKEATKFAIWYGRTCLDIPEDYHEMTSEPIRTKYYGVPCIFLKNKRCSIYKARPIICRTTKVTGDFCGKPVQMGYSRTSKPIKLAFDQVITEIIKKEEKMSYGKMKVMPLRVWPLDEIFKNTFFNKT